MMPNASGLFRANHCWPVVSWSNEFYFARFGPWVFFWSRFICLNNWFSAWFSGWFSAWFLAYIQRILPYWAKSSGILPCSGILTVNFFYVPSKKLREFLFYCFNLSRFQDFLVCRLLRELSSRLLFSLPEYISVRVYGRVSWSSRYDVNELNDLVDEDDGETCAEDIRYSKKIFSRLVF